jgi:GAF domain-containing protein
MLETKVSFDPRLRESLTHFVRALEVAGGEAFIVSILLLSRDGKRLACFIAPSLPDAFCEAIEGGAIGPKAGSCGTAAYLGHEVYVHDIETDPLWDAYRGVALEHGLRSCWSTPIRRGAGEVVATFAIYHRQPSSPSPAEVEAIRLAARALLPLIEAETPAPPLR